MITIDQMIQREVQCCVSSLVATLAKGFGTTLNPNHPIEGAVDIYALWTQAHELAAPVLDYEETLSEAGWTQQPGGRWWRNPSSGKEAQSERAEMFLGSGPFIYADDAQDALDYDDLGVSGREVYEHWAVSSWLAEKLQAHGEKVDTDFAGLNVWARTTTGQAISMDAVIQDIYKEMVK